MSKKQESSRFTAKNLALIGFIVAGAFLLPNISDIGSGYDKEGFRDIANELSDNPVLVDEIVEAMGDLSDDEMSVGKVMGIALKMRREGYKINVGDTDTLDYFKFDGKTIVISAAAVNDETIKKAFLSPVFNQPKVN